MPRHQPGNSLRAARELYLEVTNDPSARPLVVASWQRSIEYEVKSGSLNAPYLDNPNLDSPLARAALPILDTLHEQLADDPVSTMITDRNGVVLSRKVSHEGLTTHLNRVRLAPGHVFSERYVGTNGIGTALASGRPVVIAGRQHYVEDLREFHCAAVPILHPTRRTLLGAFNLTSIRQGSDGMLMAFARSVAAQIEAEIEAITSRRERALFQDYMEACSSARPGPVLALNRDVVMMNEQLSTAVTGPDHHALLDHAREMADHPRLEGTRSIPLPSGRVAELRISRCRREDSDAGAVFRVRLIGRAQSTPALSVPPVRSGLGLVGSAPHWLRAVADSETAFVAGTWLHLLGEAGVGKRTLVEALHRAHGAGRRLQTREAPLSDSPAVTECWLHDIGELLAERSDVLLLSDVHLLGDQLRQRLTDLLLRRDGGATAQVVLTSQPSMVGADDELDRLCGASVEVPALRHRYGDTEQLARFFLRKYRPSGESRFSGDALTVLRRCPWPENVRQLESVIRGLARQRSGRMIQAQDLPPECRVSSNKVLTTIEALERDAILRGLMDHNSNVQRTAQDLGISRATMYRKMRRYGIVPSSLT
ncbi:transcriptional regulator [Streptomyces viridochromogenes DSM 40736]|uniref:Transcriptional regulator n=1 Tax=Streptomyces viridochromogenes (strain DSM 40736 / JCM 4977 / BCRC 1201 / Tue 494) TaxID=591159 RepID=D9XDD7_STRVT|nr:GAF domain-containing protein [Streptomyces viridochromogenes]EFL36784.1 transcriptional regulator [Streptomyces viridochromogenes DSM 40736]